MRGADDRLDLVALGAYDPSGGAGISLISSLLKQSPSSWNITALPTTMTLQDDDQYRATIPMNTEWWGQLKNELDLAAQRQVRCCYLGWCQDPLAVQIIADWLDGLGTEAPVVFMDPVLKASAQNAPGYEAGQLNPLIQRADWLFPNHEEWRILDPVSTPKSQAMLWLTGRVDEQNEAAVDVLLQGGAELASHSRRKASFDVHGSGCSMVALALKCFLDGLGAQEIFLTVQNELDRAWSADSMLIFRQQIQNSFRHIHEQGGRRWAAG